MAKSADEILKMARESLEQQRSGRRVSRFDKGKAAFFLETYWHSGSNCPIDKIARDTLIHEFLKISSGSYESILRSSQIDADMFLVAAMEEGLLDQNHKLTTKGREYLIERKKITTLLVIARHFWNSKVVMAIAVLSFIATVIQILTFSLGVSSFWDLIK